jgi:CBS-domain-containing membrane protein
MALLDNSYLAEQYLFDEAKKYAEQIYLENEMTRYKAEAVKRLYIMANPKYAEQIAVTIAYAYDNDLPEAEAIVNKLNLEDKHIAALLDDEEKMEKIILQEKIEDQMEARFHNYPYIEESPHGYFY